MLSRSVNSLARSVHYLLRTRVLMIVQSSISGEIKVEENIFGRKLMVDNTTQSISSRLGQETGVWKSMIPDQNIESALILGFGGGTLARLLVRKYPGIKISGYELDPEIVRIAQEYFTVPRQLNLHTADARDCFTDPDRYDLVVVDLYKGSSHVAFTDSVQFISQVKSKLNPSGTAVFNRVPIFEGPDILDYFHENLKNVFTSARIRRSGSNRLYWVWR